METSPAKEEQPIDSSEAAAEEVSKETTPAEAEQATEEKMEETSG